MNRLKPLLEKTTRSLELKKKYASDGFKIGILFTDLLNSVVAIPRLWRDVPHESPLLPKSLWQNSSRNLKGRRIINLLTFEPVNLLTLGI
jgi:hypothetical protein